MDQVPDQDDPEESGSSTGSFARTPDTAGPQSFLRLVVAIWSQLPAEQEEAPGLAELIADLDRAETRAFGGVTRLGRFEVLGELGRGGGGFVFLAFDPVLQWKVALKVPGPHTLASKSARERFLREARVIAALRHPSIVTIHEAGEIGPLPYIVMDYYEEGSLAAWMARRPADSPLPTRWAARLVARVADAVQHAHDLKVLHRDLKPSNVLLEVSEEARVGPEGHPDTGPGIEPPKIVPRVADFGLAKIDGGPHADAHWTLPGVPLGTLPYMAPEAARGDADVIGPRTDVYGIGAILYELVTGRPMFSGPSQGDYLDQVRNQLPPAPRSLRKDLPRDLETICLKCLEKEPRDRYQAPSEVADELRRFLQDVPIAARPAPLWRRSWSRLKRHPTRSTLIGLGLAAVVLGTYAWLDYRDLRRRGELDVLMNNLASTSVAELPEVIARLDPNDGPTYLRLRAFFEGDDPRRKLAAALALAGGGPEYALHGVNALLRAEPGEIAPIARLLHARTSDLPRRLAAAAAELAPVDAPEAEVETHDRGRANAAAALLALGGRDGDWSLLRFGPDPQARSFLVHLIGPSGLGAQPILDRLAVEPDVSIRRALLQALGEVPEVMSDETLRRRVISKVGRHYEGDDDAGVHSSAKWLLLRMEASSYLEALDRAIAARGEERTSRSWRLSPSGLTLISAPLPELGRVLEVSDTEITLQFFKGFRADPAHVKEVGPTPDSPVNNVNYCDAARFCNWLSEREGVPSDQLAYVRIEGEKDLWVPVSGQLDRAAYRLPTDQEFEALCRAGTITSRFYGRSPALLRHYARFDQKVSLWSSPVARTKPNDLGLFDMLGNAFEICQSTDPRANLKNQAALCGGCWAQDEHEITSATRDGPVACQSPNIRGIADRFGFRVVRTSVPMRLGH